MIARNTAFTYKGKAGRREADRPRARRSLCSRRQRAADRRPGSGQRAADRCRNRRASLGRPVRHRSRQPRGSAERDHRPSRADAECRTRAAMQAAGSSSENAVDPDARDLVMRGWALYYRPASIAQPPRGSAGFRAGARDRSASVDARIGIAPVLVNDLVDRLSSSVEQDKARAEQLLLEALERDTNRSMAHFAMGMLRRIQNRLSRLADRARRLRLLSIAITRRAFQQLGITLMCLGQPEAAIPHIEKAIRLNPHDPNIASYYWALGSAISSPAKWMRR